tara:strand:+ start:3550 stop:6033 length:2484 start_codon:yes stop_codon:yes gene_type:complete
MMKIFTVLFIALCSFTNLSAQAIKGKVVDEQGKGLPFVNITINNERRGTSGDLDGNFEFSNEDGDIKSLQFSYIGFETTILSGESLKTKKLIVVLKEKSTALEEVTVVPGKNPAHRLINNAVAMKKLNDPEELESFSYYTYSKFWVTFNIDSLDPSIDTVKLSDRLDSLAVGQEDSIVKIDSSNFEMHQFFSTKHLFFMETITERLVKRPRDNERVLAQKTSGFKSPMFALIVTQLQSFSFYGDFIGIGDEKYLNPLSKGSTNRYIFIIEDSLFTEEGDTIFTVSFRPRLNRGFKGLKGALSLHSGDWAIVNVRATPAEDENSPISIRQEYRSFGQHKWFPVSFEADIFLSNVSVNSLAPQAILRRKISNINLDPNLNSKDISRAEISIDDESSQFTDSLLLQFRGGNLDSTETNTYTFIDSVSEAEGLEKRLQLLITLSRGYIPYKWVNIDINKLINFNRAEGFRLGLGIETNDKLSPWFRIRAAGAYGFKDKLWKQNYELEFDLNKAINLKTWVGFQDEIFETSGLAIPYLKKGSILDNNYRRIFINQWDYVRRGYYGISSNIIPGLNYSLIANYERRETLGNYQFVPADNRPIQNLNDYAELRSTLRYAPNEKIAETPFGQLTLEGGYPIFWLSYNRGFEGIGESGFNYDILQFRAEYKRMSLRFGESSFLVQGAKSWQDLPAAKLFTGSSNGLEAQNFFDKINAADRNSFETMAFNEFLNDEYLELMWRQDFKSLLFRRKNFAPHIEIVNRMAIGNLRSPQQHLNISTKSLSNPYFESGIELNRLLVSSFSGLGIGIYYRYGAQSLPEPIDNLAIKLTSKFVF